MDGYYNTPNKMIPLNDRAPGELAQVAIDQLEPYRIAAVTWPVYTDGRCNRCAECHQNIWFSKDPRGRDYAYGPVDILTLKIAHIRQCHDGEIQAGNRRLSMNASTDSKDSIKFWTFLTIMLLAVAVAVTLIDLTIKASILAESNSMKLTMEDWEVRYGPKQEGRSDKRDHLDPANNGHLPGDVLATGDAGLEAGSSDSGDKKPFPTRARNGRFTSSSDGN